MYLFIRGNVLLNYKYRVNNKPFISIPCCSNEVFLIYKLIIISIQGYLWNKRREKKMAHLLVLANEEFKFPYSKHNVVCDSNTHTHTHIYIYIYITSSCACHIKY